LLHSLVIHRASELANMEDDDLVREIRSNWESLKASPPKFECRVIDGSYSVTNYFENDNVPNPTSSVSGVRAGADDEEDEGPTRATQHIDTVVSASPIAAAFRRIYKGFVTKGHAMVSETREIMKDTNLNLQTGKMYLVLGAPGSGKSSLLKMIANTLRQDKDHVVGGTVSINGHKPTDPGIVWTNLTAYIDQIDRLHPFMTVSETLEVSLSFCSRDMTRRMRQIERIY
jgi:ABC-type glutathione transport system ATPase component